MVVGALIDEFLVLSHLLYGTSMQMQKKALLISLFRSKGI